MISLGEYPEGVRMANNIELIRKSKEFDKEMERFVHAPDSISKQIACKNIIKMTEKPNG